MSFSLKEGMEIGVASAATQIEGGEINHSWLDWYRKGHIKDGSTPARANNHYNRWQEDTELMKSMGLQVYRLGIEWARIEPEEGAFNNEVIEHYIEEIKAVRAAGIKPLVTLHHFTNPMWFEEMGAFEKAANAKFFLRFVRKMVTAFGELVNEYITINEPNVYAVNGYFFGEWPPGDKSLKKTIQVMNVMALTHIRAYQQIHKIRVKMGYSDTRVSFANHIRVFAAENPNNPIHQIYAKINSVFFQEYMSRAMMTGEFKAPFRKVKGIKRGRYCDFIAVNYYTRSSVSGLKDGVKKNVPVNDLGWEIYPQGIVTSARALHRILPLPIYITENGTCDNEDTFRSRYIYEHLKELCESDLPVKRYYHWCFVDNFEWIEGESARFGVVKLNYETEERTIKLSGEFLQSVIKAKGVTEEIYEKYVHGQRYNTNY